MKYEINEIKNKEAGKHTHELWVKNENGDIVLYIPCMSRPSISNRSLVAFPVDGSILNFSLFYGDVVEGA